LKPPTRSTVSAGPPVVQEAIDYIKSLAPWREKLGSKNLSSWFRNFSPGRNVNMSTISLANPKKPMYLACYDMIVTGIVSVRFTTLLDVLFFHMFVL